MPDLDLAALKALAEKATKGKRCLSAHDDRDNPTFDIWCEEHPSVTRILAFDLLPDDARLIAACDPDTILALIAEIEDMRARRCENCVECEPYIFGKGKLMCNREHHIDYCGILRPDPDHCCAAWRAKE